MNTRFLTTLPVRAALILGSICASTTGAHAQSAIARAKVPFEFVASGRMMPAGEYSVEVPDFNGVIVLHGTTGNPVALLTTVAGSAAPTTTSKMIFERRNGIVYLSAVEWPDNTARVMSKFKPVAKPAFTAALR